MKSSQFKEFLSQLNLLTFKQKARVGEVLRHAQPVDGLLGNLGVANACRHCQSKEYYRWGCESGIQRYKCRSCGRTYNALTKTPLAKLRKKAQWLSNAEAMLQGTSVKATAEMCGVATSTSFRWRHQLACVNKTTLTEALKPVLSPEAVLCTDGKKSYSSVAACCGVLHKQLNIKAGVKVLEQVYHIQNVNAYDSRLKGWMRGFHGVATKYLQNYLGWRRWIDARKNPSPMSFLQRAIYPKNTFPRVMLI